MVNSRPRLPWSCAPLDLQLGASLTVPAADTSLLWVLDDDTFNDLPWARLKNEPWDAAGGTSSASTAKPAGLRMVARPRGQI
jgi:hypothetical protein